MSPPVRGRAVPRFVICVLALVLLAPACHKSHAKAAAVVLTAPPIPSWLVTVVPLPGSSDAGVMAVGIRPRPPPPPDTPPTIHGADATAHPPQPPPPPHSLSCQRALVLRPRVP